MHSEAIHSAHLVPRCQALVLRVSPHVLSTCRAVEVLREQLECDRAVGRRAHVGGYLRTDEVTDAYEVLGKVAPKPFVERGSVHVKVRQRHRTKPLLEHLLDLEGEFGVVRMLEDAILEDRPLVSSVRAVVTVPALGDCLLGPDPLRRAERLGQVEQARVGLERLPKGGRATSVVGDDDQHLHVRWRWQWPWERRRWRLIAAMKRRWRR